MPEEPQQTSKCCKCTQEIGESSAVNCDKCKSIFHEACVKINDNMLVWHCIICRSGESSNLNVPAPRATRSRSHTSKQSSSKNSGTSSSSKARAVLEAFDEETRLLKKQAREKEALLKENHEKELELVRRKQSVINELTSSSGGSSKSSGKYLSVSSAEKVQN